MPIGSSTKATAVFTVITTLLLAAVVCAMPADAGGRSWNRGGTVTGPGGNSATWQRSGHCEGGSCSRSGSYTGPAGYTRSWERDRTCSGGTCTVDGSYTGRAGNTWSRHSTITVD